ncbi:MAG: anthranilate phosphoribosyltransferase [SAR324 cluster bacterium]|nr:anthranilate phosphoribosyltransferase [SAR324 cluster bacterium]
MNELLQKLLKLQDLTFDESHQAIQWIMSEDATPIKAGAFLALLQAKGANVEEIAGAATAMRQKSAHIQAPANAVDTCSTGGNGISTFNISTCAAIIAAAGGAVVAKHGNRSNTRKSGSAEALEALGVNINIDLPKVEQCLAQTNICFCYAIKHHPAMKFAGPIRKELGIPTIFNILGPLTNPAGAMDQVLGVPSVEWTHKLAQALQRLGSRNAMVVTGEDGLCELTTTSKTYVAELRNGLVKTYSLTPEDLGMKKGSLKELSVNSADESAQMIRQILSGKNLGPAKDVAILNAAAALYVAEKTATLKEGIARAKELVENGMAMKKLEQLIDFTQS